MSTVNQQYKLEEAFISADRLGDEEIDVSNRIFELTLFESLESPYLTGSVIITDDAAIFNKMNFRGTEYLTITISSVTADSPPILNQKRFVMSKIVKSSRPNDTSETLMIYLVEPHFFLNSLKPFSRAYTSSIEKIITQILNSELSKSVDISYLTNNTTAQGVRKVIIPYMTPLEACEWLRDRATTANGSPLFLYASIHDENLRLGDLDKMLLQPAFNETVPYTYSQAATASAGVLDEVSKATQILAYKAEMLQDTLTQIEEGGIGCYFTNTDVGTGTSYRSHVSSKHIIRDMKSNDTLKSDTEHLIFDERQKFDDVMVDDYNSLFFHQISSSGTYDSFNSYHDGFTAGEFELKARNMMLRSVLYKNRVNVILPGTAFMISRATVGDIVRINFLNTNTRNSGDDQAQYDPNTSGNYLVYRARHTFRDTRHDVSVDITRINKTINKNQL